MNNDLISREALKEALNENALETSCGGMLFIDIINRIIDNAPTVPQDCSDCKRYDFPYFTVSFDENKLKEIVQTEVIDKIKSGEIVLQDERPQGEWIYDEDYINPYRCDKCNYHNDDKTNFCPNCGADMRKGGAE